MNRENINHILHFKRVTGQLIMRSITHLSSVTDRISTTLHWCKWTPKQAKKLIYQQAVRTSMPITIWPARVSNHILHFDTVICQLKVNAYAKKIT